MIRPATARPAVSEPITVDIVYSEGDVRALDSGRRIVGADIAHER